jgi:hypothetical protein
MSQDSEPEPESRLFFEYETCSWVGWRNSSEASSASADSPREAFFVKLSSLGEGVIQQLEEDASDLHSVLFDGLRFEDWWQVFEGFL